MAPSRNTVVEHVVVWRREAEKPPLGPKESDFDELVANGAIHCPAEVMESEDPLYILYTSGM